MPLDSGRVGRIGSYRQLVKCLPKRERKKEKNRIVTIAQALAVVSRATRTIARPLPFLLLCWLVLYRNTTLPLSLTLTPQAPYDHTGPTWAGPRIGSGFTDFTELGSSSSIIFRHPHALLLIVPPSSLPCFPPRTGSHAHGPGPATPPARHDEREVHPDVAVL